MSQGLDFPLTFVQQYASKYLADLMTACNQVSVVGSVRRMKMTVHDLEFLVIPNMIPVQDLFGKTSEKVSALDPVFINLYISWGAKLVTNGDHLKKVILAEGLPLEINISDASRWGVEMVIKTGPADFSKRCVTIKQHGGYLPSNCVIKNGWQVYRNGTVIPMPSEEAFLDFLELGWINPQER